ncbi:glutamine synthetase family protein [Glutamicibacter sp. PS]|uniref:glutamine synthetase family protein n=1 Tax=Glutamicibacter sp. PS TaxID=3075634 RepID=UPI002843687D|nr:glutamine synthetase family protein [Glutamicibacter sp. PS]MDR4534478.1 glutamine synthetase family protein [Glutamicibacter sp. PS]
MTTQDTQNKQSTVKNSRMLSVEQLSKDIEAGVIDSVVLAFTDMQGRLQGKIIHGQFFLDTVLSHGTEACNYLLAVDTDMNTVDGYKLTSWETGYGDMEFVLDYQTIRRVPYLEKTAIIQADIATTDGRPVPVSPRSLLRAQQDKANELGLVALAGTELEFVMYTDSYEDATLRNFKDLTPANQYNVDYSILGSMRVEPLLRDIRNAMYEAGMIVESAKGECNFGQHEIAFRYDDVITTADNHTFYKLSAKHMAAQRGQSITFMAKPNEREGSSCHIHMSLRGLDGSLAFWDPATGKRTKLYNHFIAGVLATMREFTLFYAPNINSYKRFAKGSFAPTAVAWGLDNRTCSVRLVGEGHGARMENRLPGADANPYLAMAAMLAGGLYGMKHELELPEMIEGNAYASDAEHVPHTMAEARELFANSKIALEVFGEEVVKHYTHYADIELEQFNAAVTDWEVRRGFERH